MRRILQPIWLIALGVFPLKVIFLFNNSEQCSRRGARVRTCYPIWREFQRLGPPTWVHGSTPRHRHGPLGGHSNTSQPPPLPFPPSCSLWPCSSTLFFARYNSKTAGISNAFCSVESPPPASHFTPPIRVQSLFFSRKLKCV